MPRHVAQVEAKGNTAWGLGKVNTVLFPLSSLLPLHMVTDPCLSLPTHGPLCVGPADGATGARRTVGLTAKGERRVPDRTASWPPPEVVRGG